MKTNLKLIAFCISLIGLIICSSCSPKENGNVEEFASVEMASDTSEYNESMNDTETAVEDEMDIQERKLIKNGDISFETKDIEATKLNIVHAVDKFKGYISSDKIYTTSGARSNSLEIRIPANDFDRFLSYTIDSIQELDHKDIYVNDVTEEFLDIQARVKTKKELEQRYLALLNQAHKVTEILEIERELGTLRAEIESIEGRLNFLKDQVAMSTLTITFYEEIPTESHYGQNFKDGFANGWENFIWFFVMLTNIWPFLLLSIAFIALFIYLKRRKRKRNQKLQS